MIAQMTMCNVEGVTCSAEPTEKSSPTLQLHRAFKHLSTIINLSRQLFSADKL